MDNHQLAVKLGKDLHHFGISIPYSAAMAMIDSGWCYDSEKNTLLKPAEERRLIDITITDNPLPDMRISIMNRMRNEH